MTNLSRIFYKFNELSDKWQKTELEILQSGAKGEIVISVCLNIIEVEVKGRESTEISHYDHVFVNISQEDLLKLSLGVQAIKTDRVLDHQGNIVRKYHLGDSSGKYLTEDVVVEADDLIVLEEEVQRVENAYPTLLTNNHVNYSSDNCDFGTSRENASPGKNPLMADPNVNSAIIKKQRGGKPPGPLTQVLELVYRYHLSTGNTEILRPGNKRSLLRYLRDLANEKIKVVEFENQNIATWVVERIKEVKVPRGGPCHITTQDTSIGNKTLHGREYADNTISQVLTQLRKKYPIQK